METLRQDIAYALRQMRQSPVFTLTAMLTLALGIGATTAIFSLIHTVMLKSLPVVDPSSLYRIGDGQDCCVEGSPQDNWGMFSYPFLRASCRTTRPSSQSLPRFRPVVRSSAPAAAKAIASPIRFAANSSAATTSPSLVWSLRRPHHPALRRSALVSAGRHAELSHLAAAVRLRPQDRRLDLHPRRTSLHHHWHYPAWVLRRDPAQRSTRPLGADPAGANLQREQLPSAALSGLAARDRPSSSRRVDRCYAGAAHRRDAPMAGQ